MLIAYIKKLFNLWTSRKLAEFLNDKIEMLLQNGKVINRLQR